MPGDFSHRGISRYDIDCIWHKYHFHDVDNITDLFPIVYQLKPLQFTCH